ncbi:hypothetical protein MXMO3_00076 [Maritalea myrionectae]|uniref:Pentapeptide repeat-containing protein n=1 Tax=Maritalea myrionectae TaxID=454601 RepID=A0A2R4M9M2_9HYPH|nr:pentapeptide repeat-containing protein [Maritalea myrionectae]AVX02624.1 hypothetical protein MXMO3_00076 [Maritalea myrionectae]
MAEQPDFSEFSDWHRENFEEIQAEISDFARLKEHQREIINRNLVLLENPVRWKAHAEHFEKQLEKIETDASREEKRDEFTIHLGFTVQKRCDCSGFLFPCAVDCRHMRLFDNDSDFSGATFRSSANFQHIHVARGDITFQNATFCSDTNFSGARFETGSASFQGVKFFKSLDFSASTFTNCNVICFEAAEFKGEKNLFKEVKFNDPSQGDMITFSNSEFSSEANFEDAVFKAKRICFSGAKFLKGGLKLQAAEFHGGELDFSRAEFNDGAFQLQATSFRNSAFIAKDIHLNGNALIGDAATLETKVTEFALNPSHGSLVSFKGAQFHHEVTFDAEYLKEISFRNATFSNTLEIAASTETVPDFRHAKFDRAPTISGLEVKSPQYPNWFELNSDQQQTDKLRKIKQMAEANNDHEKASQFFAMEMAAKRGTEIRGWWPLFVSWLYMKASNFGQSYGRPLECLAALLVLFYSLYLFAWPSSLTGWQGIKFSFLHSLRNLIPFFDTLIRNGVQPELGEYLTGYERDINAIYQATGSVTWFSALGIVEQLIGGVLFFLLLLGLRNTFRMR